MVSTSQTAADTELPEGLTTIVDVLDRAANEHPGVTAIICGDNQISYHEYRHGAANFAHDLQAMGAKGARVVLLMGNSIEMSIAIYAVWAAGGAIVMLNPLYTERELVPLIKDADPEIVLCDAAALEKFAPIAEAAGVDKVVALGPGGITYSDWLARDEAPLPEPRPARADRASLQYTGGTTGLPKGAEHDHLEIMHSVRLCHWAWPTQASKDRWCDVAPQFHIWGLCMTSLTPVYAGATLVLMQRYDPGEILSAFQTHKVTVFAGGPSAIFHGLMGHPNFKSTDFSSLRLCAGGGSPFAMETINAWEAATGTVIHEGYGMSEGAPISLNLSEGNRNKVMTCGPAGPGVEVSVVDVETGTKVLPTGEDGELRVRGPQMMKAYWKRPEETANAVRDSWIHTGDIGHLDEDGYIVIVDRKKDMAIVNGFNVFPREIDEVLFAHPDILEAAAIGVPDAKAGETIHAYVVPQAGAALKPEAVIAHCESELVKYKVPSQIFVVEALPKTGAAKVDEIKLRERSKSTS